MPSAKERHEKIFAKGEGTERIEYFSDAVMAIALTLLVLDLRLPEATPDAGLTEALLELWPNYLAYGLSFWIISINWLGHYRRFRVIERYDTRLIHINFIYLLLLVFVPFPTSVLSEHGAVLPAVLLYAGLVALLGLVQIWMWSHVRSAGLLSSKVDEGVYRLVRRNLAVAPIVFGLSMIVAFVSPVAAMVTWFLQWPVAILLARVLPDDRQPA